MFESIAKNPDPDRSAGVLAREVPGREYLDRDERDQAEGEREKAPGRHVHIVRGKLPVLKQGGENGRGQQAKSECRGCRNEHHEAEVPNPECPRTTPATQPRAGATDTAG